MLTKGAKLKQLTLVYENCETLEIPAEFVSWVSLSNISETITSNFSQQVYNDVEAKETVIYFDHIESLLKKATGMIFSPDDSKDNLDKKRALLLKRKDITHVELTTDKDNLYVSVAWDDDPYTNGYQENKIKGTDLIISIKAR